MKLYILLAAFFAVGCNQNNIPTDPVSSPVPTATATPGTAPVSATNAHVLGLSASSLRVTFTNASGAAVEVDRRDTNGSPDFVKIKDLPSNSSQFDDTGLNSPWRYDYKLIAHNGSLFADALIIANILLMPDGTASFDGNSTPSPAPTPIGGTKPVLPSVPGNPINIASGADLQVAVNSASAGSKLILSGSYSLSTLSLKSGVNLTGNATINGQIQGTNLANVRIDGLTLKGTVTVDNSVSNVWLTNNVFDSGNKANDLVFHGGKDVHVVENTFQYASDIALLGWVLQNSEISYNLFQYSSEHLHLFWGASGPNNPDNVKINHNIFRRSKRYTMELQGGPNTIEVAHNWIGDWTADDIRNNCLSTTMSIATGGSGTNTTSYHVKVHDNIVGYFPPNPPISPNCWGVGSPYELMGSDIEGWNNIEFGLWKGGPLTGWTTPAWKWHDNIKVGSTLLQYSGPAGEAGYQAPAAGNYVNNKVMPDGAIAFPSSDWAYTDK